MLGTRFAAATHGASGMTEDQFVAIHQGDFDKHAADMFRRVDWNGDGKLTLDEFVAPQRAHFQMMDRDGTGTSCRAIRYACRLRRGAPPPDGRPATVGGHDGGGRSRHGAAVMDRAASGMAASVTAAASAARASAATAM